MSATDATACRDACHNRILLSSMLVRKRIFERSADEVIALSISNEKVSSHLLTFAVKRMEHEDDYKRCEAGSSASEDHPARLHPHFVTVLTQVTLSDGET